jgi:hypothetical protein
MSGFDPTKLTENEVVFLLLEASMQDVTPSFDPHRHA